MRGRPSRLACAALIALFGFWLLAHLTVATWLTRQANERAQGWSLGVSPWHWDFSDPRSVVTPGSHGLDQAKKTPEGLALPMPDDGVISVSLALRGEHVDMSSIDRVEIELDSTAPLRLALLSFRPQREWLVSLLAAGKHRLGLALDAPLDGRADALLLRIESEPGAILTLQRLSLRAYACPVQQVCSEHIESAPFFFSPEQLLAYRDTRLRDEPAIALITNGIFGHAGQWLGLRLPSLTSSARWVLGVGVSVLLLAGLAYRLKGRRPPPSATRAAGELAATLGVALALLLAGWPARDTPWSVGLLLALCLASLAILPTATPPTWRWVGAKTAWKAALGFTLIALVLTWPLALLEHEPRSSAHGFDNWRYPAWALLQQWLLLIAIMPRVRQLVPDASSAALVGGIIFGLLHAPNFSLMVFTFAAGSVWAWLGQRDRALLPLAGSHLVLGLWLMYVAPLWLLRSAEIGGRYLMAP